MNARTALLAVAVATSGCNPYTESADLAELPNARADLDFNFSLDIKYDRDGDVCGVLDPSKVQSTFNGAPLAMSWPGGAETSRHGLVSCSWVMFELPSPVAPGPADIVIADSSKSIHLTYPAFGDARAFVPGFDVDAGVAAGSQLAFTWSPASDAAFATVATPDSGFVDPSTVALELADGGELPLAFSFDAGSLSISIPAAVAPGDYTLAMNGFCWSEAPTTCEGLNCPDHSGCEQLHQPLTVR